MSLLKHGGVFLLLLILSMSANAGESFPVMENVNQHPVVTSAKPDQSNTDKVAVYIRCKNPRPEVCNQSYTPVCATRDTGIRCIKAPCPSTKKVTYSNGCMACTDPEVIGYLDGTCGDDIDDSKDN